MLTLSGSSANGEHTVTELPTRKKINTYTSTRLIRYYGDFQTATVQIGFKGRDGVNYFEDELYSKSGAATVIAGKGGAIVVKVLGATSSTQLYIDELFV